jgi:hypothetical protein
MNKYNVTYTTVSHWEVDIEAESGEQASQLVADSATPTSLIVDAEGYEAEPHFHQTDVGDIEWARK